MRLQEIGKFIAILQSIANGAGWRGQEHGIYRSWRECALLF